MGYKANDPCINKAFTNERLFVLMARDKSAPQVVCEWIKQNIYTESDDKLREAFESALEMKNLHNVFRTQADHIKDGDGDLIAVETKCTCVLLGVHNNPCDGVCHTEGIKVIPPNERTI